MDARLRVLTTYKLLNNTRYFRLRLCAGGVVTGVLAGVIISCFRLALTGAASLRANLQSFVFAGGYTPPAIALFCGALLIAAALLAWLAKAEPQAAGSGIPQVKGAVLGLFKLRWLRILLVKFAACALAIGSGLSLGRAGPSIQMGAMAGQGVSRIGTDLFSQSVSRQVSSAQVSLTSVFGMGTGGPSPLKAPTY